jgi:hypothetical protein
VHARPVAALPALALALVACTGAGAAPAVDPVVPTVPRPLTSVPAPGPSDLEDVEAAYLRSWAVYARAVGHADPSGLPRAFAGSALVLKRREVERLRQAGEGIRVRVRHHPEVALLDADTAVVTDVLENHMVRIDARSRRPLEADPEDRLTRAYTLRREAGTWKVTEAVALG